MDAAVPAILKPLQEKQLLYTRTTVYKNNQKYCEDYNIMPI